jgi:phage terminase large subunit
MTGEINIPIAFEALFRPKRFKVFYGGRGGAKSWALADAAILDVCNGHRFLCVREYQNSIDDSVHELIKARIEHMGLVDYFNIQSNEIHHLRSGGCFRYAGLARNAESLKSKFGYTRCWVEEAETVTEKSLNLLTPTIREMGSEIWFSYNPNSTDSPVHKRYVIPNEVEINANGFYEDDLHYVRKVTYEDNPWFAGSPLESEMLADKASNYKKYLHVWRGECDADYNDSIIEPEWFDASIDAHIKMKWSARGERVLSFDPADEGSDSKAIAYRYGFLVEQVLQKRDGDIDDAIAWAFDHAFDKRADTLVYDSVGVGAGVKVGLIERIAGRNIDVVGFGGGDSPTIGKYLGDRDNKDVFRNKRAQYWWLLRDRFENTYKAVVKGEYIDPIECISLSSSIDDLAQLKSELIKQQRKRASSTRLIQMVSKEDMRKDGIKSPNMADALCMLWAIAPRKKQDIIVRVIPVKNTFSRR